MNKWKRASLKHFLGFTPGNRAGRKNTGKKLRNARELGSMYKVSWSAKVSQHPVSYSRLALIGTLSHWSDSQ